MTDTYQNEIKWAKSNKKRIDQLPSRLTRMPRIDQIINDLHTEIFEEIDCLQCGNCCRTTGPMVLSKDIQRLSKRLKCTEKHFTETYLRMDEDGDFVFKSMPCPFLGADNHCAVYEDRPKACRAFPHTDQKGQIKIFDLTRKNARICPAVSRILQHLVALK